MRLLKRLSCFALRVTAFVLVFLGLALFYVSVTHADSTVSLDAPVFAVAAEKLTGPYRGTVMLAIPFHTGHIGLILNRPTKRSLTQLFPEHEPSKAVVDPIYLGGFHLLEALFAVTRAENARSPSSIALMPGIWLERDTAVIDSIIETTPNAARYYAGLVIWPEGGLEDEIKRGILTLRPADPEKLFLPDTSNLYELLRARLEI